jgi:hypothetical protein
MTVENEPKNETAFRRKIYVIGWILFLGGVCLIVAASRGAADKASEYMKDGGFHLATAGLVLLVVEWSLRGEFIAIVRETIQESLHRWAAGRAVVRDVLDLAFVSPEDRALRFADDLSTLVDRLCALRVSEDWAKDVYRSYLSDVIRNVKENAESLSDLSVAQEQSTPPKEIKLFSPAQRTDTILARLMSKLHEGGRYDVFSDIESWDDQLKEFFAEHQKAVQRKVKIRRIFIVRDKDWTHGELSPVHAGKILTAHLSAATKLQEQTGGYHIRLLDAAKDWGLLKAVNPEIETDHYGIFTSSVSRPCIQVRVTRRDLSKLQLARLPVDSDEIRDFDLLWNGLEVDLDENGLKTAVMRWENFLRSQEA